MKPECFGLPSLISETSPTCKACPVHQECAQSACSFLLGISSHIDLPGELERVKGLLAHPLKTVDARVILSISEIPEINSGADKIKDKKVSESQEILIGKLPVKARQKMRSLIKQGINKTATPDIATGKNPFDIGRHGYLYVCCELLIQRECMAKIELRRELESRMEWTEGTAWARMATACALFDFLGIAEVSNGTIKIVKK